MFLNKGGKNEYISKGFGGNINSDYSTNRVTDIGGTNWAIVASITDISDYYIWANIYWYIVKE